MDFPLLIDAKHIILKHLAHFGLKPVDNSTQGVMRSYFNLKHKFIRNKPRVVLLSAGLEKKANELGIGHILVTIEQKLTVGEDLNPYLSKGVFRLDDHDHLLNDWEIYHFHLSDTKSKPNDYFFKRSSILLFLHLSKDDVYLIDIRHHNENYVFAQRNLLRIVRDNWPYLNKKFLVGEEEREIHPKFDESEISMMRKKGYHFFTQVDNHVYAPGMGSAVSGFSMKAGMEMNEFHRQLYKIHSYIQEHEADLLIQLSRNSGTLLKKMDFRLAFQDWVFYVYEVNSKQFVNFDVRSYQPPYPD